MVRIRLRRAGAKSQPTHRIVAADRESPRDGRFIEILGDYNPRTEPATIRIKEDRIYHWLSVGAQPTNSVKQIFRTIGLMDRYERFKAGEDVETLVEEGKKVLEDREVDPRTRRDDLVQEKVSKKAAEKPAEEQEPAEVEEVEEPEQEAETKVVEAEVEEETLEESAAETEPEEEAEEESAEDEEVEEVAEEPAEDQEAEEEVEEPAEEEESKEEISITDAARELAEEAGIDISTVEGTGKDGNILKSDIENLIND
jgi:small subunit ribosomal protein S16